MAAGDILQKQGSSIVWKATGGNYAITLASLANDAAREGAKGDLGAAFANRYSVTLETVLSSAPTAGTYVELYWAHSYDNASFPGGATGADSAYKASEVDEWKRQLSFVGVLVTTADGDTVVQRQVFEYVPLTRYGSPVVVNKSGQAFHSDATNMVITLTPIVDQYQTA